MPGSDLRGKVAHAVVNAEGEQVAGLEVVGGILHVPALEIRSLWHGELNELEESLGVVRVAVVDLVDPCATRGDRVEDRVGGELAGKPQIVAGAHLRSSVPFGNRPVLRLKHGFEIRLPARLVAVLCTHDVLVHRVRSVLGRHDRLGERGVAAVHELGIRDALELAREALLDILPAYLLVLRQVLPLLVPPRNLAAVDLHPHADRARVQLVRHLLRLHAALYAPRLGDERLLVRAVDVHDPAYRLCAQVLAERTHVEELQTRHDKLAHAHLVDEHAVDRLLHQGSTEH